MAEVGPADTLSHLTGQMTDTQGVPHGEARMSRLRYSSLPARTRKMFDNKLAEQDLSVRAGSEL